MIVTKTQRQEARSASTRRSAQRSTAPAPGLVIVRGQGPWRDVNVSMQAWGKPVRTVAAGTFYRPFSLCCRMRPDLLDSLE